MSPRNMPDFNFHIISKVEIKKIIFNKTTTIIIWDDNTKTIVKCMDGEQFTYEQGVKEAILKKHYGNNKKLWKDIHEKSNLKEIMKKKCDIVATKPVNPRTVEYEPDNLCFGEYEESHCKNMIKSGKKECTICKEVTLKSGRGFDHNCFIDMD